MVAKYIDDQRAKEREPAMTMHKVAQRIPFTPSKTQAALLERCFGDRRFAYNQQVEAFNTYDRETNPNP